MIIEKKWYHFLGNLVAICSLSSGAGRPSFTQFEVLQLERDYSAWSVKYKMNLENLAGSGFSIVFLAREENEAAEDDSCLFLHNSDKLISYNIRDCHQQHEYIYTYIYI